MDKCCTGNCNQGRACPARCVTQPEAAHAATELGMQDDQRDHIRDCLIDMALAVSASATIMYLCVVILYAMFRYD